MAFKFKAIKIGNLKVPDLEDLLYNFFLVLSGLRPIKR